jgi:uracil-DNA glycosylase
MELIKGDILHNKIQNCVVCEKFLPDSPKPIVRFSEKSKIAIIGQAPGQKVHDSGVSFDDKSGDTLREWLGVTKEEFYNTDNFAIVPMGFCYPGKNKSGGDAPPRKECAPLWHAPILQQFANLKLVILVGTYAIDYYLVETKQKNLTETVRNFENYYDTHFPIVHPSGLNFRWHAKNPWFMENVIPVLQLKIREILDEQN